MKKAYSFMAISKGKESTEGSDFKRYIGVAPCFIQAVNPDKLTLEKTYDRELEEEPSYVGEVDVDGEKIKNVRITFLAKPDVEGFDIAPISVSLFVQNRYRYNKDKTKVQVIDKYGRTAWVTVEQAKNHEIPVYSNGPANLDKDYRPAYVGEEDLTNFIKAYLNIPDVMRYNQNESKWYLVDNPEDSECRLDNIAKYFTGDVKEVSDAISLQPTNKVKILFGVRTGNDGRQYQAVYSNMFLRNSVKNYSKLDKDLQERKNAGAYSTTDFEVCDFKEYSVNSTVFNDTPSEAPANPFAVPGTPGTPDLPY